MIKIIPIVLFLMSLSGCAGITTSITFTKNDYIRATISGTLRGRFNRVQEFRSLLEALEYRVTEKAQ